jgi:hypothetical protein
MQCKDIPDKPILEFLRDLPPYPGMTTPQWACWFKSNNFFPENSVLHAMPKECTAKLGLAKMRQLIKRGLVKGCPCGCRGDFEITDKGLEALT